MKETVSVIIPTYKRSYFLNRAIKSVLNQLHSNIEVVVVDDNVPDSKYRIETEKVMKEFSDNPKVNYIKNIRNMGGALARNEGINVAKGTFISFLDDDDVYLPKKIDQQLSFMLLNNLDLSFTDVRIHNENDVLIDYRKHNYLRDWSNRELLIKHIMHHLTPTATYMIKRESIIKIGSFENVEVGQEFMLMLKAIEKDLKIGYIAHSNVIQYLHEGERISIGKNKIIKEKELFKLKQKYFDFLTKKQRIYVRFRYHAVIMIVGIRSRKYALAIKHLILALLISPIYSLKEISNHFTKIKRHKILS